MRGTEKSEDGITAALIFTLSDPFYLKQVKKKKKNELKQEILTKQQFWEKEAKSIALLPSNYIHLADIFSMKKKNGSFPSDLADSFYSTSKHFPSLFEGDIQLYHESIWI